MLKGRPGFWKHWFEDSKKNYFASPIMEVKAYFKDRITKEDCPEVILQSVRKKGKEKWEDTFEVQWHTIFKWTKGWSEEKKLFYDAVQKEAFEQTQKQIAESIKTDRGILMQIKQNLTRGAIVKKSNSLNELPGNLINMREVERWMKVVKVELGEVTDITQNVETTAALWQKIKAQNEL